jgi:hypothetical protein
MRLVIKSEADAWRALKHATTGEGYPKNLNVVFEDWPSFKLDFKGRDWESTVPTRVMAPLLDVQRDVNRAYASVRYNEFNLRRLTNEERDELELVVKVKKGSSIFDAELWKQYNEIAKAAMDHMDGNQIVVTVIGLALIAVTPTLFRAWLLSRDKDRDLKNRVDLSKVENERLQIFSDAVKAQPKLEIANEETQATNNRLLKATKPGDQIQLRDVKLSSDEVQAVVQSERERSRDVDLQGHFAILGNRTDKSDGFRIDVRRISDGMTFKADVPLELAPDQRELIQKAEWSKGVIELSISAQQLRESITEAVVYHAAEVKGRRNVSPQAANE